MNTICIKNSTIKELALYKNELFERIKGLVRFPMREHPRPHSEEAKKHEEYVSKRFMKGQNNLFAFSIDPRSYYKSEQYSIDYVFYRFFILNEVFPVALINDIIGSNIVSLLIKSKICFLLPDGDIQSAFRVIPFNGRLFLADIYNYSNKQMVYLSYDSLFFAEHLLSIAKKTVEPKSIFDICCGSGILGLSLVPIEECLSPIVCGIDINPRAIEVAAINALLNSIDNTDFYVQDLKELSLKSIDSFDLIIFNPPFVFMPPEMRVLHSYGGKYGLEYTLAILHFLNRIVRPGTKCVGIVASPILVGEQFPVLVEKVTNLTNIRVQLNLIGEYPPINRFKKYYKRYEIDKICQMIMTVEHGSGIIFTKDNYYMTRCCFA